VTRAGLAALAVALLAAGVPLAGATAAAAATPQANGEIAWIDDGGLWVGDPYGQHRLRVGPGSPYPGAYTQAVAWSRGGDRLAHVLDNQVWVLRPDGSDRRLAVPAAVDLRIVSAPSWFAGDTRILFVARGSDPHYGSLVLAQRRRDAVRRHRPSPEPPRLVRLCLSRRYEDRPRRRQA
jgi:hypothetical protein